MNNFKRTRLAELRINASLLLKALHSDDEGKSKKAAARFLQLPFYRNRQQLSPEDRKAIRLKHALATIALENGCPSWAALKDKVVAEDCLFSHRCITYLHAWFPGYQQAKAYQQQHGGYLLPFRKDYFVCIREYIACIGLASFQTEWEKIGFDWVNPADPPAWKKLFEQAKANYLLQSAG